VSDAASIDIPCTREQLIHTLTHAAETEHMLCCQYLFAALSLRHGAPLDYEQQRGTHDWAHTMLLIARQEMEHLGLACNLLTSVGGSPYFDRANFPQGRSYFPLPMSLERFSLATLDRFIAFEQPLGWQPPPTPTSLEEPVYLPVPFKTIGQLYEQVSWLIDNIPMSDAELFIGAADPQVDGSLLHIDWPRPGALGGVFDVTLSAVTNRATAHQMIELIISQGEGTPGDAQFTHHKWFIEIRKELDRLQKRDPSFDPAHDVVSNPGLYQPEDVSGTTIITNPRARAVLEICDGTYELLLLLLAAIYAYNDANQQDILALQYTLFPLMTQVFRPLAEVLIRLPAFDPDTGERAAPGFQIDRGVPVLPHRDAMLAYLTERFADLARASLAVAGNAQPGDPEERLRTIGANLEIMGSKFRAIADGTYPAPLMQPGIILPGARPPS
jgi:hypothetical protein